MILADPITTVSVREEGREKELQQNKSDEFCFQLSEWGGGGLLNAKCSELGLRERGGNKKCICLNSLCCHCYTQVPAAKTQRIL